jgi:hypothetical protein
VPTPPVLSSSLSNYPEAPVVEHPRKRRLTEGEWTSIAASVWQAQTASYTARQPLELNIRQWEAAYELEVRPKDFPWVGCSNVVVPIVASKLDTLLAQIASQVFVPEFYIVSGNDKEAQQVAYEVQRYLNAEFRRHRGQSTWFEEHLKWLHLGLLHGTSVMEAMWKYRKRRTSYGILTASTDEDGLPNLDEQGEPIMKRVLTTRDIDEYNDVNLRAVRLRDFMLIPDESTSIEEAAGCCRCEWLYENDLKAMVHDGLLDQKWVDLALNYVPQGLSDVSSDRQGYYDKNMGGQLIIGQGQGLVSDTFFKNRGPIKVWRIHSDQWDMDGDGWAEENVFWIHELSMYMIGWCPDNYIAPTRPFIQFSPFPRPDRFYGFSLPERLVPLQGEASTIRNQRNDAVDLAISPPLLVNRNEEIHDKGMQWGPGKQWPVADVKTAAQQLIMQPPGAQAYQEEQIVNTYADQLSGLSAPSDGAPTASRRTATEVKLKSASTNVRASMVALQLRIAARSVIQFAWRLKQQYPQKPTDGQLPPEMMALDYQIEVAGVNDPINLEENVQEALGMYNLLRQDPDIAGDAVARYNLKKNLLVATHTRNMDAIIGTAEEAAQKKQAEAQAKQQQAQMQQAVMAAQLQQGQVPKNGAAPGGHHGGGAVSQPKAPGAMGGLG